jgi:hypothetical protein
MRYAAERRNLDESIEELRDIADGRNDILARAAGITAGAWDAGPSTRIGHELIAAGLLILAGGGRGMPLDYDELERWTRVGYERGTRSGNGEAIEPRRPRAAGPTGCPLVCGKNSPEPPPGASHLSIVLGLPRRSYLATRAPEGGIQDPAGGASFTCSSWSVGRGSVSSGVQDPGMGSGEGLDPCLWPVDLALATVTTVTLAPTRLRHLPGNSNTGQARGNRPATAAHSRLWIAGYSRAAPSARPSKPRSFHRPRAADLNFLNKLMCQNLIRRPGWNAHLPRWAASGCFSTQRWICHIWKIKSTP